MKSEQPSFIKAFKILSYLREKGRSKNKEIADNLGFTRQHANYILKELTKHNITQQNDDRTYQATNEWKPQKKLLSTIYSLEKQLKSAMDELDFLRLENKNFTTEEAPEKKVMRHKKKRKKKKSVVYH